MKKKVAIFIPYFGNSFPEYFKLWMQSANYNNFIDFYIITNIYTQKARIGNITFINCSWESFKSFVQSKFDFKISLEDPYKLCDLKPMYGYLFKKIIGDNYLYWGHSDLDLIFGNLKLFCEEGIKKGFSKIGIYGHFSLYKNNSEMNFLFKKNTIGFDGLNYKDVLKSNIPFYFDEIQGVGIRCYQNKINIITSEDYIADLDQKYSFFRRVGKKEALIFKWTNGKLYGITSKGQKEEFAYVHFQKRKLHNKYVKNKRKSFYILPNRISIVNNYDFNKFTLFYYINNRIHYYNKMHNINKSIDYLSRRKKVTTDNYCQIHQLYNLKSWTSK
ncbi:DUF6625 family protein [Limosilactobacillus reuteri]|uniref:DUF6625 family protein n=1 Tax=Limosilactobacillus reuteri TaxID=1598 RepID=UPI000E3D5221|nr:DUF6625 family protein [Limosilactobacillus reuteri]